MSSSRILKAILQDRIGGDPSDIADSTNTATTIDNEKLIQDSLKKMKEVHKDIDSLIYQCNDYQDSIVLACVMLTSAKRILDNCIGTPGLNKVIWELLDMKGKIDNDKDAP